MRILIGLILQITAIIFIGSSYYLMANIGDNESIIILTMGIVLWAVAYWFLHDYKQTERSKT